MDTPERSEVSPAVPARPHGGAPGPLAALAACAMAAVAVTALAGVGRGPLANLVRQLVGIVGPALAVTVLLDFRPRAALGFRRITPRTAGLALAVGASWWAIALFAVLPAVLWALPLGDEELAETARSLVGDSPHPIAVLLGLVLAPAVAEELLFRGLLCGALARRYGAATAALGSAAVFSLFHPPLSRMPLAFATGLVLAGVFLRTGSVVATMVTHAVHNAIVLLAVPAVVATDSQWADLASAPAPLGAVLATTVAGATILLCFRALGNKTRTQPRATDKTTRLR